MGYRIENGTTPVVVFVLVDATDDETAETGLSPTVNISKNGGSFAATTNSASEIAQGFYKVTLTATETDTDGPLALYASAAGTNIFRDIYYVETQPDSTLGSGTLTSIADEVNAGEPTLSTATLNTIADHVLRRAMDNARASSDGDTVEKQSLLGALSKMVNKTALSGSTLTVYEEDNTTSFFTQTVTTDSNAAPVTSVT